MALFVIGDASNAGTMIKTFILGGLLQTLTSISVNSQYQVNSICVTPDYLTGTCVGIKQCLPLLNKLRAQPLDPTAVMLLRKSQCGFEDNYPQVCCPISNVNVTIPPHVQQDSAGNDDTNVQYNLSKNPLLPTDCGEDLTQRIVGGERTNLDEFPWMTLLEFVNRNENRSFCGGVLINSRYVLTAAHCVIGKDLPISWRLNSVRLGEYNTATNPDCVADSIDSWVCADDPISVRIEEQIAHESYNPQSKDQKYDIALLRLSRNVAFTNYIKPICLPSSANIGKKLIVAGWGKTEHRAASDVKLKLTLPLTDKKECQETYRNKGGLSLGFGQICAGGQKGKDSCQGDSGGPLMSIERTPDRMGKWSVVGIVSIGPLLCGSPEVPGVYSKVIDFMPWILDKMKP